MICRIVLSPTHEIGVTASEADSTRARPTVVVCRPAKQAAGLVEKLTTAGFVAVPTPLIDVIEPADGGVALREVVKQLARFSLVAFTSANAVDAVKGALGNSAWPAGTATAAVGRASAVAVVEAGFPEPFVPTSATAADLAAQVPLPADLSHRPVLAPLAELASDDLVAGLEQRGGLIERVVAYRIAPLRHDAESLGRMAESDFAVVTSPSIARELAAVLRSTTAVGELPSSMPDAVAIGPRTASAALDAGLSIVATADPHDDVGLVEALVGLRSARPD